jgi:hypothetical protein
VSSDSRFLGAWEQIRPESTPARICLTFADSGILRYDLHLGDDVQHFSLTWSVDGEILTTVHPEAGARSSTFRFASPTMLVVEQRSAQGAEQRDEEQERYVYRRMNSHDDPL